MGLKLDVYESYYFRVLDADPLSFTLTQLHMIWLGESLDSINF